MGMPAQPYVRGMVGKGRHPILGLASPDAVLSLAGPVGLAASAGTALLVDMVTDDRSGRTLRDICEDGPRLTEISPVRAGVALLRGGGADQAAAVETLTRLARQWPALVVRVDDPDWPFPVVPAIPLFPGALMVPPRASHCVWQPVGTGSNPPGPGHLMPRIRPAVLRGLLAGRLPTRSRWVSAWRPVWEMPWA